jgi:S1-C subfamily serine protease
MRFRSLVLAALMVGAFVYLTSRRDSPVRGIFPRNAFSTHELPSWSEPVAAQAGGLQPDEQNNIDVYKSNKDSVVYITSTIIQRTFFGNYKSQGLGSGFLISADGEILTNNHVVSGSSKVEVTLPDQSTYQAEILDRDQINDLALIKITPKRKLTFLRLGDSDGIQVGQKVLAIGQPLELAGTLTVGVISSLHRNIDGEENRKLEDMIQTDAAINPGNSGGPLLDSSGNVIGINTAIYGPNGNIGIGFAMPINKAKAMLEAIRSGKKVLPAGRLGVVIDYIPGDFAVRLNLPSSGGLLVEQVVRDSSAQRAGLRGSTRDVVVGNYQIPAGGDLITAIDGKPVKDRQAIDRAISSKHAGDALTLTIYRDGHAMDVKVMLGGESEPERF